jgi:hypothetical protein
VKSRERTSGRLALIPVVFLLGSIGACSREPATPVGDTTSVPPAATPASAPAPTSPKAVSPATNPAAQPAAVLADAGRNDGAGPPVGPAAPRAAHCPGTFAGKWKTPLGWVHMTLDGDRATGRYPRGGFTGRISEGGKRLDAEFKYTGMSGSITYLMAPDGKTATATWNNSLRMKGTFTATCGGPAGGDDDD